MLGEYCGRRTCVLWKADADADGHLQMMLRLAFKVEEAKMICPWLLHNHRHLAYWHGF